MPVYPYEKGGKEHFYYATEVKDKLGNRQTLKKRGFKSKREAQKAERQAKVDWENGDHVNINNILVVDYITDFISRKRNITPDTKKSQLSYVKNHIAPIMGKLKLQAITVHHIENLITELYKPEKGLSGATIKLIYTVARTPFKAAYRKGLIKRDPFEQLDASEKPKEEKVNIDYWSKEEAISFLNNYDDLERDRLIYFVAIYCGLRKSEILGLQWKNIDLDNKKIRVVKQSNSSGGTKDRTKTQSGTRVISFSNTLLKEFKKHRKTMLEEQMALGYKNEHDLVFPTTGGKTINGSDLRKRFIREIKRQKIKQIRFHDLRHTCATINLQIGTNVKIVQEMLGHKSIQITYDTYSHLIPDMQEKASELFDKHMQGKSV